MRLASIAPEYGRRFLELVRKGIPHCHDAQRARERDRYLSRLRQQEVATVNHQFHRQDGKEELNQLAFFADAMLGRLARWLYILGYDTA